MAEMSTGKIKRLIKNFGFIAQDDGGEDVYFRPVWVKDAPSSGVYEGLEVEYEAVSTPRGLQTKTIRAVLSEREKEGYRFLNPYNFVGYMKPVKFESADKQTRLLAKVPPPPHDRWVGLNGDIECTLEAVTPLFVSDSHAIEGKLSEHRTFRFFQVKDKNGENVSAIPGSSIRGMIRSVFEMATNSCFAHFDYEKRLSFRLNTGQALKLVPGRVEGNKKEGFVFRPLAGTAEAKGAKSLPEGAVPGRVEQYKALRSKKSRPLVKIKLNKLNHGDPCLARVKRETHTVRGKSIPGAWRVLELYSENEDVSWLEEEKEDGQRIFRGWLCINNQNTEAKRFERFFFRDEDTRGPETIPLSTAVCEKYEQLIDDYRERHAKEIEFWRSKGRKPCEPWEEPEKDKKESAFSRFIIPKKKSEKFRLEDGELVYARIWENGDEPEVKFLGSVAIPRAAYENRIARLLPNDLWKCENYDNLCPACRTFGWVHGTTNQKIDLPPEVITACAGRLSFGHGKLKENTSETMENVTLSILGSPKPTTCRFYLKHREKGPRRGISDSEAGYDNPHNVIRGRKLYRHHGHGKDMGYWMDRGREYRAVENNGKEKNEQNRTVKDALKPGAQFSFKIKFENMAPMELGALLWCLEMEKKQYHRLGFAKPLGFGSVFLTVDSVRLVDRCKRYSLENDSGKSSLDGEGRKKLVETYKQAMEKAYGKPFEKIPFIMETLSLLGDPDPELPVHYPRTDKIRDPEGKNYEWFMGNNRNPSARYPLENPGNEKGLPLMDKFGNEKR